MSLLYIAYCLPHPYLCHIQKVEALVYQSTGCFRICVGQGSTARHIQWLLLHFIDRDPTKQLHITTK